MVVLTREQMEDRLAALHRASLELVRNLSLDTVLERIVHLALEQAGATYAALGVVDEYGNLTRFIPVGMPAEEMDRISHPPIGLGLIGQIRTNRKTIRIPVIADDPRSVGFPPQHPPMHSFLGVPILSGDHLLGQIYLTNKLNHYEFTELDAAVIETLAAYAAVAITNARLYENLLAHETSLTARNQDLALLNELAASLTGSLEVDKILDKTLSTIMAHLQVQAGEVFLREESEREFRLALHRGDFNEPFSNHEFFLIGQGYIGTVAATGKPKVSTNLRKDMRYLRPEVIEDGFQCIACIPMIAHGTVVGVMTAATRLNCTLGERELHLLMAIGSWAGLAIENARLLRQARRLAVLEERERIGMDLHDGIIQSLYGVGLALDYSRIAFEDDPHQSKEKILQSIDALNSVIQDIRTYILDLRPRQFNGEDLKQGLQRLVDEFQANCSIPILLVGPENGLIDFPAPNATALFHICQESLANIAKHSRAHNATVNLWTVRDRVLLEITDDGQGFDLSKMSVTLGHGLSNMHTRARKVGGDVEITAYPGEGTTVLAWVPRITS